MSDLTAFLLARLDEDEAAGRVYWRHGRRDMEVYAKRRMVAEFAALANKGTIAYIGPAPQRHYGMVDASYQTLRHLAAVYSEHPDYREEWRP